MIDSAEASAEPGSPGQSAGNVLDSVAMVVRIIEGLAASETSVGVTELARALNESKARIHRNLASLRHFGIVEQDASNDRYRLGWRLYQLGQRAGAFLDLRRLVDPTAPIARLDGPERSAFRSGQRRGPGRHRGGHAAPRVHHGQARRSAGRACIGARTDRPRMGQRRGA